MPNTQIQNFFYKLSKFWLFITFLQSLYAWFTWGQLSKSVILLIAFFHCLLFALITPRFFKARKANVVPLIIFAIAELYVMKTIGILSILRAAIQIFLVAFILFLKDNYKIDLLKYFTRGMALILAISLFVWIVHLIGIPLPHSVIKHPDFSYLYDNYIVFLADNKGAIPRFCSIFLEPGQLGMIMSFLLYANKFELKRKEVLIIFISTLFTLSLAAYILTFISAGAYLMINYQRETRFGVFSTKKIIFSLLFVIFVVFATIFFTNYKSGDNVIYSKILYRLELKDGTIRGNNRFTPEFIDHFNSIKKTPEIILGIGNDYLKMEWRHGNAGWKVFLLQYGIVGILLVFLLYLSFVYYNLSKLAIMFLVVYMLCFLQAAYPLWLCELYIFLTAMPFLSNHQSIKETYVSTAPD